MRRYLIILTLLALLLALFPNYALAACSHDWYPIYSEAAHPHAYFHECKLCGVKEYTGGYATKAHGDGSWGSGTCPSCGTHTFVGRSCTTDGVCSCGATQSAYGHDYSLSFCDAAHPHRNYLMCDICYDTYYPEPATYTTKAHGDGSWGSGTCPLCGPHTYVGRSCTTDGICSCGGIKPAYGHNYSSYCDISHPHRDYQMCSRCYETYYPSPATYTTMPHGDGSAGSGTCPSCGTHTFVGTTCTTDGVCSCGTTQAAYGHDNSSYCDTSHPHRDYLMCSICNDTYYPSPATYTVMPHGDGSAGSGTCPSCGTHAYVSEGYSTNHPHPEIYECYCGDSYESTTSFAPPGIFPSCSQCQGPNPSDNICRYAIKASNVSSFSGQTYTLSYDATVLELVDLCCFTYQKESSVGMIWEVGLTFESVLPGEIVFTVDKTIPDGMMWSGILNIFSFRVLSTQDPLIELIY